MALVSGSGLFRLLFTPDRAAAGLARAAVSVAAVTPGRWYLRGERVKRTASLRGGHYSHLDPLAGETLLSLR